MIITISEIEKQFDKWNEVIFNNELPRPVFSLMQTKRTLGQFRWPIIGWDESGNRKYGYTIRISTYYDRPLESYIDTIVHEMLHYYIKYKGIKDTSSHGTVWKRMAREISQKYNLVITRTNPAGGGVSEAVKEKIVQKKISKYEYVFVCKMNDGIHYGAGVVPSSRVHLFAPQFKNWNHVEKYKVVKAPWNQTYYLRHLRTVCGVGYITKDVYDELLKNKILDY